MKILRLYTQDGITLVALVVTIVILLILAGVTLLYVMGDNSIFKMASDAKNRTDEAKKNEQEGFEKYNELFDKYANGTGGASGDEPGDGKLNEDYPYSVPGLESKIAPTDLFEYEIIEGVTLDYDKLPKKAARIKGIKEKYCNGYIGTGDGEPSELPEGVERLFYKIIYNGERISEELVIPYTTIIDGEKYTITEAKLEFKCGYGNFPAVKTIVFPDTVSSVLASEGGYYYVPESDVDVTTESLILPRFLKKVDYGFFREYGLRNIKNLVMWLDQDLINDNSYCLSENKALKSVKLYGKFTTLPTYFFDSCTGLESVSLPSSVREVGDASFGYCTSLKEVSVGENLEMIGDRAFYECRSLTSIVLPKSLKSIGADAFSLNGGDENNIKIYLRGPEGSIPGAPWGAKEENIFWNYKGE